MLNSETFRDISIFEDMDKAFNLVICVGMKASSLNVSQEQAEKLKDELGIDIIYIPF